MLPKAQVKGEQASPKKTVSSFLSVPLYQAQVERPGMRTRWLYLPDVAVELSLVA